MSDIRCSGCGEQNSVGAKYCAKCGSVLSATKGFQMSAGKAILLVFVVMILGAVLVGGCAYGGYRRTIALDEGVKNSWADVESVLQRRFDLIPNVVETVKGYAKHEKDLLQGIADVRKSYFTATTPAEKAKAATGLEGALSRLLVLQEKYPELKANQNFRDLQVELEGTENRINERRSRYNDEVRQLNAYIRAFPGSMYAGWSGVKPAEYFQAAGNAKEAPQVKF